MKKIFFYIISAIAFITLPLFIAASILSLMLLQPDFHISIIKNLKPIKTFIEAKNFEIESDIKNEIEKKTNISEFKMQYEKIKKEYEEKLSIFNRINKTELYEKIEKQIDEIDDLEWEKSKAKFKNKDEFNDFKKLKIKELKKQLKEIEDYREAKEEEIDKAEDEMKSAKKAFEKAEDELKDKKEEARDIVKDREGEFLNELYHDIAKIEPKLTEKFNKLFLESEIKKLISTYINFLTSYQKQKNDGNIYASRIDINEFSSSPSKKIILPPIFINFNIKEENSIEEKNIFSGILVDVIKSTPGLKSPWLMSKIFSMVDSWIIEKIANSKLKNLNFNYSSGVLKSEEITISGQKAIVLEKAMMAFSIAKYLPYITIGLMVILTALIIFLSDRSKDGIKNFLVILKISSSLVAIIAITAILISLIPGLWMPEISSNPVIYNFIDRSLTIITIFILGPMAVIFLLLSFLGGVTSKLISKKN
jgi:hypothetical protein